MNIVKKSLSIILTSFSLSTVVIPTIFNETVLANFEGFSNSCVDKDGKTDSSDSDDSDSSSTNVGGDWTKKGTKAYKTAKQVFDYWVKKGASGALAAGIIGNIGGAEDPSFKLDQREIGGGPNGGGGLYQFTPWTKYANGSDGSWSVKSQSDFVLKSERANVESYMKGYKDKTPEDCATAWMNIYERPSPAAKVQSNSSRRSAARKAYTIFGGANISGSSALAGATEAAEVGEEAKAKSDNPCQKQEVDDNDGNIIKIAKKLTGYFSYEQVHGVSNIGSVEHPDKNGKTDCSGFVWLVLKKAGYSVPENMGWYTKTMQDDAEGPHKWLKKISTDEAKPGDVVIVNTGAGSGDAGHTAILTSKWKGDNTKVIQQTNNGKGVSEGTFRNSFTSLLNAGGKPCVARPVKKK